MYCSLLLSIIGISAKVGMYRDGSSFDIYKKVILTVVMIGLIVFFTYLDYKTCYINKGATLDLWQRSIERIH